MRVLVTGGTGFVSSHTVKELLRSGHEVHLLVRSPNRIAPALEPVGVEDEPSYTVGGVTDAESVEKAMEGCAAVIHGASVYTLDSRQAGLINRVNVRGTDIVLAAAHRMGLSHIVHVSSTLALLPTQEPQLSHESLPSNPPGAYMKSKADSDRVAMKYQEQGAPVVITNPCGIWGPDDPYWGDSAQLLHNLLKTPVNVWPKGGLNIVDVRDVARVNAAALALEPRSRRYVLSGAYVTPKSLAATLSEVTGRKVRMGTAPAWSMWPAAQFMHGHLEVCAFPIPLQPRGLRRIELGKTS